MNDRILVAYASRAGSTAGVAEAIGRTLESRGAAVDVCRMEDVQDLTPYQAVVAGSAIQRGRWLPEAMRFMQTYHAVLATKPFAAFSVCMTLAMPQAEKYRLGVAEWLEPVRTLARPVREGFFAGTLDIGSIPSFTDRLKFRLSVALGIWPEGDRRDWNAIRAWAESLRPLLQPSA